MFIPEMYIMAYVTYIILSIGIALAVCVWRHDTIKKEAMWTYAKTLRGSKRKAYVKWAKAHYGYML